MNVEKVLCELTLEEKASLTTGAGFWNTTPIERLGVPSITLSDGPHGVRRQTGLDDHLGIGDSYPATCFPPAAALGSSWDPDLLEGVGAALGREASLLDVQVLLGPGINIKRSPLCGRNFEYLSEDPLIAGELGAALIKGVQSEGVGVSLKHFAVNNQQVDQMRVSADVDERSLREIYLAGFERAVKEARPATVMCSYNKINGVYASENHWLLTQVLRDEWGFEGLVVSDWGAVNDRVQGLAAGLDLEMPDSGVGPDTVVAAVRQGRLDEAALDEAARHVLNLVAQHAGKLGSRTPSVARDVADRHHALAREVAARCAVLLKNDGDILPLKKDAHIAVIGEFARMPSYQGGGSSKVVPTRIDSALTEIERLAVGKVAFAAGYSITPGGMDTPAADSDLVAEAVRAASESDVAVVFLGLWAGKESEGYDRTDMDLPADQIALLRAVSAANSEVVVVLSNGSAVRVANWDADATAIVEGWLLGQAGGGAIADLLFGIANPSGRLAETIPLQLTHTPAYGNYPGAFGHVHYGEGVFVGYRWYDSRELEVSYPFGHGLSYTTFEYSNLRTALQGEDTSLEIQVTVTVANTGSIVGREIVQMYVEAPSRQIQRPKRELRGFRSVELLPGESRDVTMNLSYRDLAYFHPALKDWHVESGTVSIYVGASSRDLRLSSTVEILVSEAAVPLDRESTIGEWFAHPQGQNILEPIMAQKASEGLFTPEALEMMNSMPLTRVARFPGINWTDQQIDDLLCRVSKHLVPIHEVPKRTGIYPGAARVKET